MYEYEAGHECHLKREDQTTVQEGTDLLVLRTIGNEVALTNYGGVSHHDADEDSSCSTSFRVTTTSRTSYNSPEPFLSVLMGRYGHIILRGKFTLMARSTSLACNDGKNHLHGGPTGFHAHVGMPV